MMSTSLSTAFPASFFCLFLTPVRFEENLFWGEILLL